MVGFEDILLQPRKLNYEKTPFRSNNVTKPVVSLAASGVDLHPTLRQVAGGMDFAGLIRIEVSRILTLQVGNFFMNKLLSKPLDCGWSGL